MSESGGGVAVSTMKAPQRFALMQNHPNPFNPSTTIRYDIPDMGGGNIHVQIAVYDVAGKLVKTLRDRYESAGSNEVEWDGRDHAGRPVGSGVYFYRIKAGNMAATRKMVLIK
jgi:flagellar hook assembly protein FlgD